MSATKINLLLGDIIEIVAPSNDTIHKEIFLITYIDKSKIIVKNEKKKQILGLENNTFNDKTIEKIHILRRHPEFGFAKQNKLIPGQWINIHFNDDVPVIVTGEILSLDEDMIEVKTYPSNKIIYIDFEYKGIKDDLFIEKIVLREAPRDLVRLKEDNRQNNIINIEPMKEQTLDSSELQQNNQQNNQQTNQQNEQQNNQQNEQQNNQQNNEEKDEIMNNTNSNLSYLNETSPYLQAEMFTNSDDIQIDDTLIDELNNTGLGRDLGRILQTVQVEENELRYGIQMQINDLTSDMVAKLPIEKRNKIAFEKILKI